MSQNPSSPENPSSQADKDLEREVNEALGGQSIEELMQAAEQDQAGEAGEQAASAEQSGGELHHDVRRGRIAAIRGEDVFVELAGEANKLQGIVPLQQFDRPPRLGAIMDFVVDRVDEGEGLVYLSREGAVSRATWDQLQRGTAVEARVMGTNKGGLELEMVGGIRAFMPASQIDLHHVGELEPFVGQKLEAAVQEIDRRSKKVVLSRRQLLQTRREQAKEKVLGEIEPGQVREGTVSNIVPFGAFVDLGGVDGLVHVSDMSYTHVDKPQDVVSQGEKVQVKVLSVDKENERISLGLKQVQPDPWEGIENRYRVGDQVSGKVVRTTNFGAFIELEPGVEGLLPISEMSWRRIGKAEEVVKQGDTVRLAVLSMDPEKRRLSLSLKQSQGDPWVGAEHKYPAGEVVEGKVIGTTDFGAFVELEPGIEGLVHISELADRRVGKVEDVVKPGQTHKLRVLEISEEDRRARLSIKQVDKLEPEKASKADIEQYSEKKAAPKQPRRDLKGGMGSGGGMGMGLGDLKL